MAVRSVIPGRFRTPLKAPPAGHSVVGRKAGRSAPYITCMAAVLALSQSAQAQLTLPVNARSTYLLTNSDGAALDAKPINLARLGIHGGDVIRLQRLGIWSYAIGVADLANSMAGVFSTSSILLPPNQRYRLPGALDAGVDFATYNTYVGNIATDIPEDFYIDDTTVQVPPGAQYLFVAPVDSLFGDNTDLNGDYAVKITKVSPAATNLLVNGSFEAPALSYQGYGVFSGNQVPGWTISGTNGDGSPATVDLYNAGHMQPAPGEGSQALELVGTPGAPFVSQRFPTNPGQEYILTGWVGHHAAIAIGRFNIYLNDQLMATVTHQNAETGVATYGDMKWRPFSYRFKAATSMTRLTFKDTTGVWDSGGSTLDGLSVFEVPGDSSLAMSEVGLLASTSAGNTIVRYALPGGAFAESFDSGPASPQSMVYAPDGSLLVVDATPLHLVVEQSYNQYLKRFAEPGGANGWTDFLKGNNPPEQMWAYFIGSLEFWLRNGSTNGNFVNALFRDLLGRGPSSGEFNGLVSELNGGADRSAIAYRYTTSPEAHAYLATLGLDTNIRGTNQIVRLDRTTGAFLGVFATFSGLDRPSFVAWGPDGNLYVSSTDTDRVLRFNGATGAPLGAFVPARSGGLNAPTGLSFGPDGNLYVGSYNSSQILRYNGVTGAFLGVSIAGDNFKPLDLTFGVNGYLYFTSPPYGSLTMWNAFNGAYLTGAFNIAFPWGIAFGADNTVLNGNRNAHQLLRYNAGTLGFLDAPTARAAGGLLGPTYLLTAPASDVTSQIRAVASGLRYDRTTGRYVQSIQLTNTGANPIVGPLSLALDGLDRRIGFYGRTGFTASAFPSGSQYRTFTPGADNVLSPGETLTLPLEFTNPSRLGILYTPRILAGTGTR